MVKWLRIIPQKKMWKPVFSCSALVETDQVKKDTTEWKIG